MNRPSLQRQIFTHAFLMVTTIAVLYPVLWVLKMALTPGQAFSLDPNPIPSSVTLEHFAAVIGTKDGSGGWLFGRQMANSLLVAGVTSSIGIGLATTAGYAMSRWNFPGRDAGTHQGACAAPRPYREGSPRPIRARLCVRTYGARRA